MKTKTQNAAVEIPPAFAIHRDALLQLLCGMKGFPLQLQGGGLTDHGLALLIRPIVLACRGSGIAARAFMRLRGRALKRFCANHALPRLHVRLAQEIAKATWTQRRIARLARKIAGPVISGVMQ